MNQDKLAQSNATDEESQKTAINVTGIRYYLIGFASIGAMIGIFSGLSSSPVVQTILPLFFLLLAGTGGAYLAKMDFEKALAVKRAKTLGLAFLIFSVTCTLTTLYCTAIRTGSPIRAFLPTLHREMPTPLLLPTTNSLSGSELLHLAVTRTEMQIARMPEPDQRAIIFRLANQLEADNKNQMPGLEFVRSHIEVFLSNLNNIENAKSSFDTNRFGDDQMNLEKMRTCRAKLEACDICLSNLSNVRIDSMTIRESKLFYLLDDSLLSATDENFLDWLTLHGCSTSDILTLDIVSKLYRNLDENGISVAEEDARMFKILSVAQNGVAVEQTPAKIISPSLAFGGDNTVELAPGIGVTRIQKGGWWQ